LPAYRILEARIMGNLLNGAWSANAQFLPTHHLEPIYRKQIEVSEMRDGIKIVQELALQEQGSVRRSFPPEANRKLGGGLGNGWHVHSAWCDVSVLSMQNILAQVRSRLLDFMLELRGTVLEAGNNEITKANTATIDTSTMFKSAIFGHNTTIIVDSNNTQHVSGSVKQNDFENLRSTLASIGLPEDELSSLKTAVEADQAKLGKPSFEGETGTWYTKLLGRAMNGGFKIGTDVLTSVATKALITYISGS
jgi:AbiTii